jgi:hypothetical protein
MWLPNRKYGADIKLSILSYWIKFYILLINVKIRCTDEFRLYIQHIKIASESRVDKDTNG